MPGTLAEHIHSRHERGWPNALQNFVGSEDGALTNTVFVSLIASCQMHGIEPWAYLRDLFYLLPDWPRSRVLKLAPAYWKQTLEKGEAQRRLDENPLRRALVDSAP